MLDFGFYNMDCMEGMKQFPDKYFDLAIVDPPYGAGFTENGGCSGWFEKYKPKPNGGGTGTDSGRGSIATKSKTRYKRIAEGTATAEMVGSKRRKQKNYNVGRCPGAGIL